MAGIKELLLAINETANNNEIAALAGASGLGDIDVNDDTVTEVKTKLSTLMSMDAAQNNPTLEAAFKKKLYGTIKGELLGNIDTDLVNVAKDLFGDDAPDKFKDIEFTSDKVKKFSELTKELIASSSKDTELKNVNEGLKKQMSELSKGHQSELKKKENEIKKINQGFNDRLIKKDFTATLSNYNLGEKYQESIIKKAIFDEVFKKVQSKAKLTLSEEGLIVPKNLENPEMNLFINNKEVTDLKELIDPEMLPYIKKSGTKDGPVVDFKPREQAGKIGTLAQDIMKRRDQVNTI